MLHFVSFEGFNLSEKPNHCYAVLGTLNSAFHKCALVGPARLVIVAQFSELPNLYLDFSKSYLENGKYTFLYTIDAKSAVIGHHAVQKPN